MYIYTSVIDYYINIIIHFCSESESVLGSRRIVDIGYIFLQIQNLYSKMHLPGFGCTFMDVDFVKEIRIGFESSWILKCKMSNSLTTVSSESKKLEYILTNKAIVNGTCAIGIGYTQLAELSANVDVVRTKYISKYRHQNLKRFK